MLNEVMAPSDLGTKGGDVHDPEEVTLELVSGGSLHGELYPFDTGRVAFTVRGLPASEAFILPERPGEAPRSRGDEYEYESAGGFEFPDEDLDQAFFDRLAARRRREREVGRSGIQLVLEDADSPTK